MNINSRVCLTCSLLVLLNCDAASAGHRKPSGRVWLATIAVQDYDHLPESGQLHFCKADEQVVVDRMREGNRIPERQIRRFQKGSMSRYAPTAENIMRELPEFLANAGPEDSVILFLSMHGARVEDPQTGVSETFLLTQDFNPESPAGTLINVRWLRDLLFQRVKAGKIMLLMDACHSGGLGSSAVQPLMASRTEMFSTRDFRTMMEATQQELADRSIYVITSCADQETSLEARDIRHGLFTHWLIQGIDGAADSNEDAILTMDELFGFVENQVPASAHFYAFMSGKPVSQHPQRFMLGTNHGDLPVMAMLPQSPATAIERLADSVHSLVRHGLMRVQSESGRIPAVGIVEMTPEFTDGPADSRYGSFPVILQKELEKNLFSRISRLPIKQSYHILNFDEIRRQNKDISRADLAAGHLTSDKIDAVVSGQFHVAGNSGSVDDPERVCISLTIRDVKTQMRLYQINSSMLINSQFRTMFGVSGDVRQRPQNSPPSNTPPAFQPSTPIVTAMIPTDPALHNEEENIPATADTQHPLRDQKNSTLSVEVWQGRPNTAARLTPWLPTDDSQPNLLCFETTQGNEIQLRLRNQTNDHLAVIVQIDGMNIIGKTICVPEHARYWSIAPRLSWRHDRWLDGLKKSGNGSSASANGGKFVVVNPPESVAGRMNVIDDLGEIRVLVYGTKVLPPGARSKVSENSLGIGESSEVVRQNYKLDNSHVINRNDERAQYVIRYVKAGSPQKSDSSKSFLTAN